MKIGLCEKCGKPANARYEIRHNKVYLVKSCRDCGRTSSLVAKDSRKWLWKREITGYAEPAESGCSMNCSQCEHSAHAAPYTVAIDVTNACNQKCPICLAYCDAMGFLYEPPMEYFDKVFRHFLKNDPKPNICFFGGEPTVHPDFLEIVKLARSYGYQVQLFTNGLKFSDKKYCEQLCSLGIQVNFGLDGTRPEIYKTLRGDKSLNVKLKGLQNIIEHGVNKLAIISTFAKGVNDDNMLDVLRIIHENRQHISVWGFVPLTPCWENSSVDLEPTTTECVENVLEELIPDLEFVPTGMMKFEVLSRFFGRQTLGGSHPNCESATLLVSDGERYRPISDYLKKPLSEFLVELRKLDSKFVQRVSSSTKTGLKRKLLDLEIFWATLRVMGKNINLRNMFGESRLEKLFLSVVDLIRGKKIDRILQDRTKFKHVLTMITIPYEDKGGLEDARLKDCPAVFAYEDVKSGKIRTTAFCSWQTVKDEVCREIQEHYLPEQKKELMKIS